MAAKDLTKLDLNVPVELKKAAERNVSGGGGIGGSEVFGVMFQGEFTPLSPSEYDTLRSVAEQSLATGQSSTPGIMKSGNFITEQDPEYSTISSVVRLDFLSAASHWNNFGDQVESSSVIYEDIFQLDFNKFLKTKGGFRPLLQRVTPL